MLAATVVAVVEAAVAVVEVAIVAVVVVVVVVIKVRKNSDYNSKSDINPFYHRHRACNFMEGNTSIISTPRKRLKGNFLIWAQCLKFWKEGANGLNRPQRLTGTYLIDPERIKI